jgi:hypothetical protein
VLAPQSAGYWNPDKFLPTTSLTRWFSLYVRNLQRQDVLLLGSLDNQVDKALQAEQPCLDAVEMVRIARKRWLYLSTEGTPFHDKMSQLIVDCGVTFGPEFMRRHKYGRGRHIFALATLPEDIYLKVDKLCSFLLGPGSGIEVPGFLAPTSVATGGGGVSVANSATCISEHSWVHAGLQQCAWFTRHSSCVW